MAAETSASGWFVPESGHHVFPLRVYYEDTDAGGIVYYVNYLKFAERARTEMLRLSGVEQQDLLSETGLGFVVRRCEVEYRAPARLDDLLHVFSRLLDMRGASLRIEQVIRCGDTDLAALNLRVACADRQGKAARIPDAVRSAISHQRHKH